MNGPIAQLAALACHANAYLAGRDIPEFFPSNSTCQFCDSIDFFQISTDAFGQPERQTVAESPDEWIHNLPLREVDGVRLVFSARNDPDITDRMSAGFVGGGHVWRMLVLRDDGLGESWSDDWHVWNQEAPDRRIWRVSYTLESTEPRKAYVCRNLAIVKAAFRESLEEILAFSEKHTEGVYSTHFAEALELLDDPQAHVTYHEDIAMPGQLSADAESLLKASSRAWVFGGMGSWNDMSFDGALQIEYENVSETLFDLVHEAIEASVASTFLES
jgi:hypothetical protein